ncbi:hypothetical protein [Paramagnetospirillum caucaseum]|uniref:hypothetical protein n=1 Tax=Paramagnetospirillum caucaseum TaxID=1244869 RepID=UPI001F45705F|nr:hypothetical protein [Paramagnetospirillum caucaseum]
MTLGVSTVDHPEAAIERRLRALSTDYPFSLPLGMDEEGHSYLLGVLGLCRAQWLLTDNGGGDLTPLHCRTILNHVGYIAAIAWMTDPGDAILVRAACLGKVHGC